MPNSIGTAVLKGHPCFDEEAHEHVGRVHLPVAPRCNIQCAFCDHRLCANLTIQHPGWSRSLLNPQQALDEVDRLAAEHVGERFVVGVAGPGEPLANAESLATLRLVRERYPDLTTCLSSNGLLLADELPALIKAGISALTVTMNALDPAVGARIYRWVNYRGHRLSGAGGAALLIERQLAGIQAALQAGLAVKVNSVFIPGINDEQLPALARQLSKLGVRLLNIMPLIPGAMLADWPAPTCAQIQAVRAACEPYVAQFHRCEHCRADVQAFPRHGPRLTAAQHNSA
ncbi:MAG: radical SAM protein [Anaerolineae bacterium]